MKKVDDANLLDFDWNHPDPLRLWKAADRAEGDRLEAIIAEVDSPVFRQTLGLDLTARVYVDTGYKRSLELRQDGEGAADRLRYHEQLSEHVLRQAAQGVLVTHDDEAARRKAERVVYEAEREAAAARLTALLSTLGMGADLVVFHDAWYDYFWLTEQYEDGSRYASVVLGVTEADAEAELRRLAEEGAE